MPPVSPSLLAAALLLAPLAVAAQEPARAHESGVVAPAVGRETRVRLTVRDPTVRIASELPVGSLGQVEGVLLSYDGEYAVLRLKRGYLYTIPVSNLSAVEQRVGPGTCRRSAMARTLCTTVGLAAGIGIGYVAGHKVGGTVSSLGVENGPRRYGVAGAVLGAALAAVVVPTVGRSSWKPVPVGTRPAHP